MKKKKLLIPILLISLIINLLIPCQPVYAVERIDKNYSELESKWYIDGNYIVYENYAKQRGSLLAYGSVGCTISRCKPNQKALYNGAATEWISMAQDAEFVEDVNYDIITADGIVALKNVRKFSMQSIYEKILSKGYTDWAAEFKRFYIDKIDTDNVVFLRIDHICETRLFQSMAHDSPYLSSGDYWFARDIVDGIMYMNNPPNDGKNPHDLIYNAVNPRTGSHFTWSSVARKDIEKYFNIYVPAGGEGPSPGVPDTPHSKLETKNYSSVYNISKAIPSGESLTNAVSASSYDGAVGTQTYTSPSVTYSATYTYTYKTQHKVYQVTGKKYVRTEYQHAGPGNDYYYDYRTGEYKYDRGRGTYKKVDIYEDVYGWVWDGTYDTNTAGTHTFTYTANVQYKGVTSADIRLIDSITVINNCFAGGSVTYGATELSNRNVSVSMTLYSQSAAAAGRAYDTVTNGRNLSGYNFAPNGNHYGLPAATLITNQTIDVGSALTAEQLNSRIATDGEAIRNAIANNSWSRNDGVSINDNGTTTTFLNNTTCTGAIISDGHNTWTIGNIAATKYPGTSVEAHVNGLNATRSTGAKVVNIPETTPNGDYPTGIRGTWTSVFGLGSQTQSGGAIIGAESIYKHVMAGGILSAHTGNYGGPEADGYPVRVHTPVIAPIEIVFNDETPAVEDTQLVPEKLNTSATYELLLDRRYYLKFDNEQWYSQIYGVPEGYGSTMDDHVLKKTVRFPFGVVYEGKYYPRTGTGYTAWIEVKAPASTAVYWEDGADKNNYESANHWQMMPFYVPSFSDEVGVTGSDVYVEVAVYAKNFAGTPFADDDDTAVDVETRNALTSEYVATTRRQLQVSGWIYDFSIVGTTNQAIYTGNNLTSTNVYEKMGALSFANIKSELKTGTLNRLGTSNIRYLKDGTINSGLNVLQTLPLRTGQSFVFNNLGNVWRGQEFAFTVKTISNLNGKDDFIRITPHLRYVKSDGTVLDSRTGDFKLYTVSESKGVMDIEEFNPSDTSLGNGKETYLADTIFDESYYTLSDMNGNQQLGNWAESSAKKENINNNALGYMTTITAREFLNRKTTTYTTNTIYIPNSLRLMSGEYEQLEINDGRIYDRATGTPGLITYWNTINNYNAALEDEFRYSMQHWSSVYSIPANTYIVDTRSLGKAGFSIRNYIDSQTSFSWETSPIVDDGKGVIIVGFDIVAYKNGAPYLTYAGANNMWLREGSTPNPDPDPLIPYEPDDVVLIDMSKSITDYMEPAIQNIN